MTLTIHHCHLSNHICHLLDYLVSWCKTCHLISFSIWRYHPSQISYSNKEVVQIVLFFFARSEDLPLNVATPYSESSSQWAGLTAPNIHQALVLCQLPSCTYHLQKQSNESFMLQMSTPWIIYNKKKVLIVFLPFPLHGIKHLEQWAMSKTRDGNGSFIDPRTPIYAGTPLSNANCTCAS